MGILAQVESSNRQEVVDVRRWLPLLALLALAAPAVADLPWTWGAVSSLPATPARSIDGISIDTLKGAALRDGRYLWRSSNGGESWGEELDLRTATGITHGVGNCARVGDSIVVGGDRLVLFSENAGGTWRTRQPLPEEPRWGIHAVDIDRADRRIALAVGFVSPAADRYTPLILKTTNGGQDWTRVTTPADWPATGLTGVICENGGMSYVIAPNGFLAECWWQQPNTWTRVAYEGSATAAITGWYARGGYVWLGRTDGKVMKRHVRGVWETREVDRRIEHMTVAFRSASEGVVIGHDRFLTAYAFHTTDGGATWTADRVPFRNLRADQIDVSGNSAIKYVALVHLPGATDIEVVSKLLWKPGPLLVRPPLAGAERIRRPPVRLPR